MAKVNTLFSYFTKSPPPVKNAKLSPPAGDAPKSCEKASSPTGSANSRTPAAKRKGHVKKLSSKSPATTSQYAVGDLLWTKLEGYPWWPSLVCNHPTLDICYKKNSGEVHVQFFDDPPTRAWIRKKDVKKFTGKDSDDVPKIFNKKWKKGCEDAEKALRLSVHERMAFVVPHLPSDEEGELSQCKEESSDDEIVNQTKIIKNGNGEDLEPQPKRRRIIPVIDDDDDDDSEEEYKPDPKKDVDADSSASSGVESSDVCEEESEPESPVKKKRKRSEATPSNSIKPKSTVGLSSASRASPSLNLSPSISTKTKAKLSLFSSTDVSCSNDISVDGDGKEWPHLKLDFLRDDKIRDINKRIKSHPDYDPKTLYVPESFKEKITPAIRQWWEMKSNHFDTVLFFKVGKFYELYHMDAVTAVNELGLIFMKGDYAHAGFPEIAYGRYADVLIQKGYKVGRVEQVETPAMMEARCKVSSKKVTKFDKVVKREICRITTKGTKTFSFIDGEASDSQNSYLLAITEQALDDAAGSETTYGVCFVDTSIGTFHMGQFKDDRHRSRFRTLISHYTPSQVLFEKGKLSVHSQQIINNSLAAVVKESLASKTEFLDATTTLKLLVEGSYFNKDGNEDGELIWPETLKFMLDEGDTLGLTAKEEYDLAVRALGACTWYLKLCKLELELLSMKNFVEYVPVDAQNSFQRRTAEIFPHHMVLDGVTLRNLDVVQNSIDGTLQGTLLDRLDQCCTPFGKRLFRQWLCSPLCNPNSINDRLDAVKDLLEHSDVMTAMVEVLKNLPDLERLLSRIHTQGSAQRSKIHPDSRAIFFEDVTYSKKKIDAFLAALSGFRNALKTLELFEKCRNGLSSNLLKNCVTLKDKGGKFPYLDDVLDFFDNAFDHGKAKKDGKIIPAEGVDDEYDSSTKKIKEINRKADDYLEEQKEIFGSKVTYVGTGRNRFQLEVPDNAAKKASSKYELQGQRKGFKRYWTDSIKMLLGELIDAEEKRDAALRDIMRRIFANFDKHYQEWDACVQCLTVLDVLISFAKYSQSGEGCMTRPEIILPEEDSQPFIKIRNGRHPCIITTFSGDEFIPNDTVIGIKDENVTDSQDSAACVVLVTGPNMGGKSTLMRQVGLIVIIAQMGCYVPADECCLTPVDRIFTRLGASDRIMSGESTFFVELSETSSILHHATKNSLVLVDELGRGTATYDGSAIACAVVKELASTLQCRTLFSTHYHSLVEEFSSNACVRLGHMACMVENEDETDPTNETITFLYKFVSGACPKSYGFNAARLASIPDEVIKLGHTKARKLEEMVQKVKQFRALWSQKDFTIEKLLALHTVP